MPLPLVSQVSQYQRVYDVDNRPGTVVATFEWEGKTHLVVAFDRVPPRGFMVPGNGPKFTVLPEGYFGQSPSYDD